MLKSTLADSAAHLTDILAANAARLDLGSRYIEGGVYTRLGMLDGFPDAVDADREKGCRTAAIGRRGGEERLDAGLESSSNSPMDV